MYVPINMCIQNEFIFETHPVVRLFSYISKLVPNRIVKKKQTTATTLSQIHTLSNKKKC